MVEDGNESADIRHLLKDVLPNYWKRKVEDEEKKGAKQRVAVKIMYGPQYHGHPQEYFRRNIGEPDRMISMHQSLYVEVFGEAARQRLLRLHKQAWMKNEPLLRLRKIPARMSLESIVQYISVELKLNKKNEAGLKDRYDRKNDYKYRGHDDRRHHDPQHREDPQHRQIRGDGELTNEENNDIDMDVNNNEKAEYHFFAFIAVNTKSFGNNPSKWGRTPPCAGKPPRRVADPTLSLEEYMKKYKGCCVCYGKGNSHQRDHTNCAV